MPSTNDLISVSKSLDATKSDALKGVQHNLIVPAADVPGLLQEGLKLFALSQLTVACFLNRVTLADVKSKVPIHMMHGSSVTNLDGFLEPTVSAISVDIMKKVDIATTNTYSILKAQTGATTCVLPPLNISTVNGDIYAVVGTKAQLAQLKERSKTCLFAGTTLRRHFVVPVDNENSVVIQLCYGTQWERKLSEESKYIEKSILVGHESSKDLTVLKLNADIEENILAEENLANKVLTQQINSLRDYGLGSFTLAELYDELPTVLLRTLKGTWRTIFDGISKNYSRAEIVTLGKAGGLSEDDIFDALVVTDMDSDTTGLLLKTMHSSIYGNVASSNRTSLSNVTYSNNVKYNLMFPTIAKFADGRL